MPNIQHLLDQRVTAAMRAAFPQAPDAPAIVQPSQDPRFGDYQANGAMALAKQLKMKPRDVAAAVLERLDVSQICEPPEIAGPGFINLRLRPDWVAAQVGAINPDKPEDRLGVPRAEKPETVVVDYSAPNLAKEMHVGHLRSTIIGDALARMLDFSGHKVVRQNHVGDWGTQFGMLVAYWDEKYKVFFRKQGDTGQTIPGHLDVGDLEQFYREAKQRFDASPGFAEKAREYLVRLFRAMGWQLPSTIFANRSRDFVVRLQTGDQAVQDLWDKFLAMSLRHCKDVYEKLGVLLTDADIRGESAYNDDLPHVIADLKAKGLITESEGAQCIFVKDEQGKPKFVAKDGAPLPLLVQKSDEGYLYATTDLAAIRYRVNELKADRILYVVDARQSLHFAMVFECARQAGFAPPGVALHHVAFGTMMGSDGRPFKTREGGTVKLMALLDEAEKRALDLVTQKNAEDVAAGRTQPLTETQKQEIARTVGIGAVKYADLAQNRTSDYIFSWEKMLSLDGNTAPYMQYAYARVRSIFRKGEHEAEEHRADAAPIPLASPQELALGKTLLRFPETLDRAIEDYRPNVLAAYLYDLAGAFTAFYDACPVLQIKEDLRAARLKLCDLTARVIQRGLGLLGIDAAERM
ncbi:MAG: arginine--tRNA ligase [Planctomycetota bacterium]|nr:arginine--tRNA ligase [Planctomycetota bacterium]